MFLTFQATFGCPNSFPMNLSWGFRAEQQISCACHAGQKGQGTQAASTYRGKLVGQGAR
jgi:hypothetical protein